MKYLAGDLELFREVVFHRVSKTLAWAGPHIWRSDREMWGCKERKPNRA